MSTDKREVKFLDPNIYETYEDRCIIFPDEAETKSKGGIIIPDTAKEKPKSGIVVLVGPHLEGIVFVGDHVHYGRYAGQIVKIEETEYDSVRLTELLICKKIRENETADERIRDVMSV